jgi:hypothetical protein
LESDLFGEGGRRMRVSWGQAPFDASFDVTGSERSEDAALLIFDVAVQRECQSEWQSTAQGEDPFVVAGLFGLSELWPPVRVRPKVAEGREDRLDICGKLPDAAEQVLVCGDPVHSAGSIRGGGHRVLLRAMSRAISPARIR